MIRVQRISPTPAYSSKVRAPGLEFLRKTPRPSRDQFKRNDYWTAIHDEMYDAYNGICMYCASWTPRSPIGALFRQTTIDHFFPKMAFPQFAYDWDNFRLCRNDLNTNKGEDILIPDPFGIRDEWFAIDFATWRVGASELAPEYIRHRIRSSFVRLRINDDAYIDERQNVAALFIYYPWEREQLQRFYPFIIRELIRQSDGTDLIADLRELLPRPILSYGPHG